MAEPAAKEEDKQPVAEGEDDEGSEDEEKSEDAGSLFVVCLFPVSNPKSRKNRKGRNERREA